MKRVGDIGIPVSTIEDPASTGRHSLRHDEQEFNCAYSARARGGARLTPHQARAAADVPMHISTAWARLRKPFFHCRVFLDQLWYFASAGFAHHDVPHRAHMSGQRILVTFAFDRLDLEF